MSAQPEDLAPDLERLRRESVEQRRKVTEIGDPEAIHHLAKMDELARDPNFWAHPPTVLSQAAEHLKRLGITE